MMENTTYQAVLQLPIGKIGIRTDQQYLLTIEYVSDDEWLMKPKTVIAKDTVEQLLCYFADPTYAFNIPTVLHVTSFQQNVLSLLKNIPVGKTQTYTNIAKLLNTTARPVGNACRMNPVPIIIPCHRVVSEKSLGGYSGKKDGRLLEIKRWLLQHEST